MFVYADNAATTCVSKAALDAMLPYLTVSYFNPSSLYSSAQKVAEAVAEARETVAACLGAKSPREIYFTSCGPTTRRWSPARDSARERAKST